MATVTLTTDFGQADGYAGIVKGVILGMAPQANLVDLAHAIPPCDIRSGAWIIGNSYKYFPQGTVHLGVVDPGVGSLRRGIVMISDGHLFVGPDNGLFSRVHIDENTKVFVLDKPQFWLDDVSSTFQGRDIFAPVAGCLARGVRAEELGNLVPTNTILRLPDDLPSIQADQITGSIVYIDVFGNLITNIPNVHLKSARSCRLKDLEIPVGRTYSSTEVGSPIAYVGSHGFVEIGVNQGRADVVLECKRDDQVLVLLKEPSGKGPALAQRSSPRGS